MTTLPNNQLVLLLCLAPLGVVFVVMKLALWLSETASFNAETEKLKRMQRGPYEVWDDEEDEFWGEDDNWK